LLRTDIIRPMVMVATASRRGQPAGIPSEGADAAGAGPAISYCGTVGWSPAIVVRCMKRLYFTVS
jgi:hypothetical protein